LSKAREEQKRALQTSLAEEGRVPITIDTLAITGAPSRKAPSRKAPTAEPSTEKAIPVGPHEPTENLWIDSDYTQVLNSMVDELQPLFGDPLDFVVYLYCYRQSWGYHTNLFQIESSAPRIAKHCGISKAKVCKSISALVEKGYLRRYETDFKRGTKYLVFLPPGATYQVGAHQVGASKGGGSHLPGRRQPPTTEAALDLKQIETNKTKLKNPPLSPLERGTHILKIETSRWPRKPVLWKPWDQIHNRLRESLSCDDFQPLVRATVAARGLGRSICIRAEGLSPEVLSESLKRALGEVLVEEGIDTLRIAV